MPEHASIVAFPVSSRRASRRPNEDAGHWAEPREAAAVHEHLATRAVSHRRGTWSEVWLQLRRSVRFWVFGVLALLILVVAVAPQLFTSQDPLYCILERSRAPISVEHPLGTDIQGCDVYARLIYGTRASLGVGLLATVGSLLLGAVLGAAAGFFGGWLDVVISRITDVVFALPFILAAIVILQALPSRGVASLVGVLVLFGWTSAARITRSIVIDLKGSDFVLAARTLGAGGTWILVRHIAPLALAPLIVVATMSVGGFIASEASLSFLNLGLPADVPSWGKDISDGRAVLRPNPTILLFPAAALTFTVLVFIVLGDLARDVLDPKRGPR